MVGDGGRCGLGSDWSSTVTRPTIGITVKPESGLSGPSPSRTLNNIRRVKSLLPPLAWITLGSGMGRLCAD